MDQPREIRSYRVVFSLERRLHRVDRFRIPLPYGLPLRSVGYAALLFALVLLLGRVPGLGAAVGSLPTPIRFAVIPGVGSFLLTRVRIDGRPAGAAGISVIGFLAQPRQLAAWRPRRWDRVVRVADLTVAPGAEGPFIRRGVVRGPCEVLLQVAVGARRRGRSTIVVRTRDAIGPGTTSIVLDARERLVLR